MPNFTAGPIPADALNYLRQKDLRVGFDSQDVWGQEHAHAFTVAKAMKLDVLDDIKAGLEQSLAEGKTFRDFAKDLKPQLQAKGWWGIKSEIDPVTNERRDVQLGSPRRLKTIYDSNMRSARSAGQWERIQRTKDALPFLLYELGPSENHRPEHVKWAGTLLPVDHPWWDDHFTPNGYGCQCRVRQVSKFEASKLQREGVQNPQAVQELDPETSLPTGRRTRATMPVRTTAPTRREATFTNQRTGEQQKVDMGLHPAWARNPGKDRAQILNNRLSGKLDLADQQLAQASANDVMQSDILSEWMASPAGELPAGVIGRQIQEVLGSTSQVVRLTADALKPGVRMEDLRRLPAVLAQGMLIIDSGQLVAIYRRGADLLKAAVDARPDRLTLVSIESSTEGELARLRNAGQVIREAEI